MKLLSILPDLYELLFTPSSTPYALWYNPGYVIGFFILLIIPLIITTIYYQVVGRKTNAYAKRKSWLILLIVDMLTVFLISTTVIGFKVFYATSISEIPMDVWVFSLWNGSAFSIIMFLLLSIILKIKSTHNEYIPF